MKITSVISLLSILIVLSACSTDETDTVTANQLSSNSEPYLTVEFSDGPNQGKHTYQLSDDPIAELSFTHHPVSDVSFLIAKRLVSSEAQLAIDELQYYSAGQAKLGENAASNWLGKPPSQQQPCGSFNLRDRNDDQVYTSGYGSFVRCDSIEVESLSSWQDIADSNRQTRMIKGYLQESIRLKIANDSSPFQKLDAEMTVEFLVPESRDKR